MEAEKVIPHSDGAGVIDMVGRGVSDARIGERVWIWNGQWKRPLGTACELIALPQDQAVGLPDHVSFEAGACLGIPALTAIQALRLAGPLDGRTILVTGAGNNVGNYTVSWTTALAKPFVLLTPYWQNSSTNNIVVGLQGWTTTSFTVQIRVMNTATAADGDFIFMVLP